jgi:sugar lactone lactonase YvrE
MELLSTRPLPPPPSPLLLLLLQLLSAQLLVRPASAAYSAGSLLLVRVADALAPGCPSANAACSRAAALYLDEYLPSATGATATLVSTAPLPATLSATDNFLGSLSLCADATCAVLAGTAAPEGAAPTAAAPYFNADRVIVRIAADGTVDGTTRVSAAQYDGMIKGVCSFSGEGYYVVGNATTNCVSYVRHGAAAGTSLTYAAQGASCATADGSNDGHYTGCSAASFSAPGAPSYNRTLLFSRTIGGFAYVDVVTSPEASWQQQGGLKLSGISAAELQLGFSAPEYFGQLVSNRAQNLYFIIDPLGGACEIDVCRGAGVFPRQATSNGKAGCATHVSYLTYCQYSGITFSLDETLLYFTTRDKLISYPAAGGAGKVLVTLPPGQEFRGVSRAPFVCGGNSTGGASPLAGWYCPNGPYSRVLPCPAGNWSAVGATTSCSAPLPSPTPSPSPSPTLSVTASPSLVPPNAPCWVGSTFSGPDWITPNMPAGLAYNSGTAILFVADYSLHEVVRVSSVGAVSTFVGASGVRGHADGVGSNALFRAPLGLALHAGTGDLYVADSYFALIRRVSLASAAVTTLAGVALASGGGAIVDGGATAARFVGPSALAIDSARDLLYVVDAGNTVRLVSGLHGTLNVATIAGTGKSGTQIDSPVGTSARFNIGLFGGIALDSANDVLYVADHHNNKVRKVNLTTSAVSLVAGACGGLPTDGPAASVCFANPAGLALSPDAKTLFVADFANHVVRSIAVGSSGGSSMPVRLVAGNTDFSAGAGAGVGTSALLPFPLGLAVDPGSGALFASLYQHATVAHIAPPPSANVALLVSPGSGAVDGLGLNARFGAVTAIAFDASDNLLVVDNGASRIRRVTPSGATTTLAGSSGPGFANGAARAAKFQRPTGIAISADGRYVYISDTGNFVIRVLDTTLNTVATMAGSTGVRGTVDGAALTLATFSHPCQLATSNGVLYVLDSVNTGWMPGMVKPRSGDLLRQVAAGEVTTLVSSSGSLDLNLGGSLSGIVADPAVPGKLFLADLCVTA